MRGQAQIPVCLRHLWEEPSGIRLLPEMHSVLGTTVVSRSLDTFQSHQAANMRLSEWIV